MDLNDLWQNHKRFILGVSGGLLAFLIGTVVVDSTWDVQTARAGIQKRRSEIGRIETPNANDVSALGGEVEKLTERLDGLMKSMNYETRSEYVLPQNESPDLFYNRRRDEAAEKLIGSARRQNIFVKPTLGLPEFTPSGSEAIQRALRGLDLVDRVITAAIEARVRSIDDIEMRDSKTSSRTKGAQFLDPLPVRFQIAGTTAAIANLLDLLARGKGPHIAFEDISLELDPKRQNMTILRATFAALALHPEAVAAEARR